MKEVIMMFTRRELEELISLLVKEPESGTTRAELIDKIYGALADLEEIDASDNVEASAEEIEDALADME